MVGYEPPHPPLLERITARQWVFVDRGLAVLFLVVAVTRLYGGVDFTPPTWLSWWILGPLCIAATLPIWFRRHWPELALASVGAAGAVATMLGVPLTPLPFIALPLYSITVKYGRRRSLTVLLGLEVLFVGALVVAAVARPLQGDVTFNSFLAVATWFVGDSVRTRRIYQQGLVEQAEERQRRALDDARRAVVEERLAIARELHDVIAHSLSVIAIQSGVGRHVMDSQPDEAFKALVAVEETSRAALHDLRNVLGLLRQSDVVGPELEPAPTLDDLRDLIRRVRMAGVPVELFIDDRHRSLPPGLELSIYRIVQEALTNVVKHAHSAPTTVRIEALDGGVVIDVANRGVVRSSTAPSAGHEAVAMGAHPHKHHGIIGMKERASAFDGTLDARALPDGGFRVLARLPVRNSS
jgi:signal transduction histidine kinase